MEYSWIEWFKESNPTAYDDLLREGGIQSSQEQDSGASLIRETQQVNEKIDDQIKPPPKDEFMFPLFGNPEMEGKLRLKVRVNSDESLNQFSSSLWISFTDSLKLNFKKDLFLNKYDLHEKDLDLEYWYNIIHQRNEAYRTMFSKFIEDGSPRLSETCNAHIEEYLSKLEDLSEVNIEDWTIIRLIVYNHIYEELKSVINKIDNFREEVEKENLKLPVVDNESLFRSQLIEVKAVIYAVCAVSLKKGSYPEEITYLFKDYKKLEDEIIESVRPEFKQLIKSFQNEDNVSDSGSDTETSGIDEDLENSEQSLEFVFNENQAKAMDVLQKIACTEGTIDENDTYVFYFWAALWVAIADAVDDEEEDEFPQGERGISKYFMSIGISEERYLKIRERFINENSHPAIISNAHNLNANDKKELIKVLIDVAFYEEEEQEVFASEAVAIGIIAGIIGLDVGNIIKKIQADYQLDENELFEEWKKIEIPFINTNLM